MSSKLFSPYTIKNVTLKNRIVLSPMCMYSSDKEDGLVTEWHKIHYATRAVGGAGLIMLEATAVLPEGRISARDLGIWDDKHIPALSELVQLLKNNGAKTAIQLAHAGRKAVLEGETAYAPSAIAFPEMKTPVALTIEQIDNVVRAFGDAAQRAQAAGFDIIEIHGAHGYLVNEFLSPLTNQREDAYGGTPENRYRILREIIEAVKAVWQGPIIVRVSANEYAPGGNTLEQYIAYAREMKEQGVDLIDCSSGGLVPASIDIYPGYQVKLAERLRSDAQIATSAVGLITSASQAEEIIGNNRADLVFMGRELLRNPYWPHHAAKELGADSGRPTQYGRS